jgi:amidase
VDDVAFLPAVTQARLLRARELSPTALAETYLERIERLDPELNAYVTVTSERALAEARAAEERLARGDGERPPFLGVPLSIKDLTSTVGVRTTFSCPAYAEHVPTTDVAVARRLREAGFVLLGKTNTPEFGTIPVTESALNGDCRNPWDVSRTPGGSSGGAAAALAAGLCAVAEGSDGGGSIRIPASCCGVFGLKPSRGRVSNAPYASVDGLGTSGPIARTVADAAALLDVLSGYEAGDPWWAPEPERPFADEPGRSPGRLRVGFTAKPPRDVPVARDCLAALDDAVGLLGELGHEVEEVEPDWQLDELGRLFAVVWQTSPALYPLRDVSVLSPLNRALLESARSTSSVDYVSALFRLRTIARRVVALWERLDVLLTPTLALPPVPIGWHTEDDDPWAQFQRGSLFTPFTPIVNVTGQPAASLPLWWSDDALPIGVQVVGPPAGDGLLLRLCAQVEQARPWAARRPPVS